MGHYELFNKCDKNLQIELKRTGLGKGQTPPKMPKWNQDTQNFGDDDIDENGRLQGKLMNLKVLITNHFCIYQGLEKNERSIKTDHTKYDVLPRKWKQNC